MGIDEVSTTTAVDRVKTTVEEAISGRADVRVLDAGCGSDSARAGFPVPRAFEDAHVLGVDIASEALERNALLDERLVADIQTVALPASSFDVVVMWDVLEHLPDPIAAIRNAAQTVRPGGILVVGVPNLWSLKGLVTKLTPFWLHRLVYRRVFDVAGTTGGPFRTHLRRSIAPARLKGMIEAMGFETKVAVVYGSDVAAEMFAGHVWLERIWRTASLIPSALSLGRVRPDLTEAAFVFERRS